LQIGYGKKTREQIRTAERDKKREQRAAAKPGQANFPDTPPIAPEPQPDASAKQAEGPSPAGVVVHVVSPTSPVAKASTDHAAIIAERDRASKAAFAEYKEKLDGWMDVWNTTEKQKAFEVFKFHPKMVGVKRLPDQKSANRNHGATAKKSGARCGLTPTATVLASASITCP
jgi:hypothetical protein